jgi:hypothetical protein
MRFSTGSSSSLTPAPSRPSKASYNPQEQARLRFAVEGNVISTASPLIHATSSYHVHNSLTSFLPTICSTSDGSTVIL